MIKLLQFLWSGCFHEWETIKERDMKSTRSLTYLSGKELTDENNYIEYTLRCKKCGEIKSGKI